MIGDTDGDIRRAVFDWLTQHREETGHETFTRDELSDFQFRGRRVPLVGPQGIWKPAECELPISIATIAGGPYDDTFDERSGRLAYAYRGTDRNHRDNRGLRQAMHDRIPLVYFVAVEPGRYVAQYPVFIVADRSEALMFDVQVDDIGAALGSSDSFLAIGEGADARRSYVTRAVRQRLHQVAFRERVIRAYQERCALCLLRHQELLDAAHITPDSHDEGEPVVTNGIALCKLHHAAFDRMFFAIRPDYVIEVRPSILLEHDGPMLVVGLQQIHDKTIYLPRRAAQRPDPDRLERRYEEFRRAS
jgi:putative restriction endonuclease